MALAQVTKLFGIREKVDNELDLMELGEKGIPKGTINVVVKAMDITLKQITAMLGVSERTLARHKSEDLLNQAASERLLRIGIVLERCNEVFEDQQLCNKWMKAENMALGGRVPLDLLKSDFGIDMVLTELGRIEHGIGV